MLDHYVVAVGSAEPVIIARGTAGDATTNVYIANSTTADVFLGDRTVTSGDGYTLVKQNGQTIGYRAQFSLAANDVLYGICAAGFTSNVQVLITY